MHNILSIVIPVYNEAENIDPLVRRIDGSLKQQNIVYEIIFIDDYSSDNTATIIYSMQNAFPISYYKKVGKKGKALSLLQGFSYAKYPVVCMIDADLQYPPEAIPEMLKSIDGGADIVIAERKKSHTPFVRRLFSTSFTFIFCNLLHRLPYDIQSGLKVFKKEIIERIHLHPTPWTFDMEFILYSLDAGYTIQTLTVDFAKRINGQSKVHLLTSSFEIGWRALQLKFREHLIPFDSEKRRKVGQGFHYKGAEFIHYSSNTHAFFRLTIGQKIILLLLFLFIIEGIYLNWHLGVVVLISVITALYFTDLLFNLFVIYKSFSKDAVISVTEEELSATNTWPMYSILCPLYKEGRILPQFVTAIKNLSYPKNKLQVLLLLEADDTETIKTAQSIFLPEYISILIVPHSLPKTKPKACNYALQYTIGKYVVIYDAEDVPDVLQLKKVVLAFKKASKTVQCLQAKLNFYNTTQNILTRIFTAEYSLWFDVMLPGLQALQAPIPLGGTSNHFLTEQLQKIGGWDSFNVTEDADLGMRLAESGFTTAVVDSYTYEEANSSLTNWIRQRSRWIKGYIQTYFVHMREQQFTGKRSDFYLFQLVIGGKILSILINPLMWILTLSYFIFRSHIGTLVDSFFLPPIYYMAVTSLFVGNFLYTYYYMVAAIKRNQWSLIYYALITPFYWVLISYAAFYGIYELLFRPHYWHKTQHGLHLQNALTPKPSHAVTPLPTAVSFG